MGEGVKLGNLAGVEARVKEEAARTMTPEPMWIRKSLRVENDPALGALYRTYIISCASFQSEPESRPLLIIFHGQFGHPRDAAGHRYVRTLVDAGWVVALPAGEADNAYDPYDSGWNVGANGPNANDMCLPDTNHTSCHTSCFAVGGCGQCSWSSCYDDLGFVDALIQEVTALHGVDPERMYLLGSSNGGMLVHYISQEMPGRFRGIITVYATPLIGLRAGRNGRLLKSNASRRTSVLALHGLNDTIIPSAGGRSVDGWLYESEWSTLSAWSAVHDCDSQAVVYPTPFERYTPPSYCALLPDRLRLKAQPCAGRPTCYEYPHCGDGEQVRLCTYEGEHGIWPAPEATEWIIINFLNSLDSDTSPRIHAQPDAAAAPAAPAVLQMAGWAALASMVVVVATLYARKAVAAWRRARHTDGDCELH